MIALTSYPGGASRRRKGTHGVVPLCVAFIPPYLLGGRCASFGIVAGLCAGLGVGLATILLSDEERWGRLSDLLLIVAAAALGLGFGADRRAPEPIPLGLPEMILRGRLRESGLGWEARDVSIARDGRWLALTGRFLVFGEELSEGRFLARGFLVSLEEPRLPGLADRNRGARWSLLRGRIEASEFWKIPVSDRGAFEGWRPRVRGVLASRVGRSLPGPVRSIIPMLIWGERATIDPEIERTFRATGTMHLLAISGLHVSLVALLLEFLLRLAVRRPLPRVLLVLAALSGYGALVGPMPSVVRSIVMAACLLTARAVGRAGGTAVAWWLALLFVACATPGEFPRPGMQLSFAGTAALILCPKTHRVAAPFVTSAVAVAVTSGILWAHFGESAPMAIVANLTGIPAFAPVLVSVLWGLLWGDPSSWTLQALGWGPARLFSSAWVAPLAFLMPLGERVIVRAGCGEIAGLASTLGILLCLSVSRLGGRPRTAAVPIVGAALLLLMPPLFLPAVKQRACRNPEVIVLPVGQGDATLIRTGSGQAYLVDTGPGGPDGSRGRRTLAPALRSLGAQRLRGVFLTHGDEDHVGGLRGMFLAGIEVDTLYLSRGDGYRLVLPRRGLPAVRTVAAPREIHDGPLTITILSPGLTVQRDLGNAGSLVLRISAAGGAVLLPGDLGGEAEERLAASGEVQPVAVLLAGHHGSGHSTGEAWCEKLDPRVALISCGPRNRFGHPSPPTLARLARLGITIHRTDREGSLSVRWDSGTLRFRCRGCGPWRGVL
jgi:competence protein ComEC